MLRNESRAKIMLHFHNNMMFIRLALFSLFMAIFQPQVQSGTESFTAPGIHDLTVPFGVSSLSAVLSGASGSDSTLVGGTSIAGLGRILTATVPVTPGNKILQLL